MHKSDSSEQREAEAYILESLENGLTASFDSSAKLPISSS